jgi:hypothetical protein
MESGLINTGEKERQYAYFLSISSGVNDIFLEKVVQ